MSVGRVHSQESLQSLVLIEGPGGHAVLSSRGITRSGKLTLKILSQKAEESAFLARVRETPGSVLGVAYGTNAAFGRVENVQQQINASEEVWTIILQPDETDLSPGSMEMAYSSYSADKLAELRARRILLNDPPPLDDAAIRDVNQATLEMFIRRNGGPGEIRHSPLPALYETYGNDPPLFVAVARLFVVLFMRAGAVVQHVRELDIDVKNRTELAVHFVGQRHQVYSNREPTVIRVDGVLSLGRR